MHNGTASFSMLILANIVYECDEIVKFINVHTDNHYFTNLLIFVSLFSLFCPRTATFPPAGFLEACIDFPQASA